MGRRAYFLGIIVITAPKLMPPFFIWPVVEAWNTLTETLLRDQIPTAKKCILSMTALYDPHHLYDIIYLLTLLSDLLSPGAVVPGRVPTMNQMFILR